MDGDSPSSTAWEARMGPVRGLRLGGMLPFRRSAALCSAVQPCVRRSYRDAALRASACTVRAGGQDGPSSLRLREGRQR